MDTKIYEQLFDALKKIVEDDKPYADWARKAAALKSWMGEPEDIILEEFISWFEKV